VFSGLDEDSKREILIQQHELGSERIVGNPSVTPKLGSFRWRGVGIVPGMGATRMPVKEFESI